MKSIRLVALTLLLVAGNALGQAKDEVRMMFDRYVKAENEHNLAAVGQALQDSAEMLWVPPGSMPVWGRDNVMMELTKRFQTAWKVEPEFAALKLAVYGDTVARLVVPVHYTSGPAANRERYLLQQTYIRTPLGWRIASIVPAPMPAQ
jgi:hypothetical protein